MRKLFTLLAIVAVMASCGDDEVVIVHTVSSINPTSGPFSTIVTITGSSFSTVPSENTVTVNGVQAVVNSATENQLVIVIPELAGTGPVSVTINGGTVVGPTFNYEYLFNVSTLAGTEGSGGLTDGTGSAAEFQGPNSLDMDGSGNIIVGDYSAIRKVTTSGVVTTVAGQATAGDVDGVGSAAQFSAVFGLKVHPDGTYYVSDEFGASKIKKVTPAGVVTTFVGSAGEGFVDGTADVAQMQYPEQLTFDNSGNLYICEWGNNVIRKVTPSGVVSVFAGDQANGGETLDGTGTAARFDRPFGIVTDASGTFYVTEGRGDVIRKITPAGVVTTFSGSGTSGDADGSAANAQFNAPYGLCIGHDGRLYIADQDNHRIRVVNSDGSVETFAGSDAGYEDGSLANAKFRDPWDIVFDPISFAYYIADENNVVIRKIQIQ